MGDDVTDTETAATPDLAALLGGKLEAHTVADLLDLQHQLGDARAVILARQRDVQAELDRRSREMEERRREEARLLGQVERPPTQDVFGNPPTESGGEPAEEANPTDG